ncbi:septum site-determining protein MinC [Thermanaeromonas sp. C210]|uniref:septum site-determining protein MinC n=1 Tax=Thermanaeromonas sp. C210 TaxID=2731925 RepID=UPI00155BC4D1|nr:septum site-determining protein MinC [Thermanaeromonas sp. C210]GFN22435.1 putative septum site-determining protein MinC [Thermanaeromonas sp. C210]
MSQDIITIKGTRKGLVILLDGNRDFAELKGALAAKFAAARGFFQGAPFILSPSRPLSTSQAAELEELCRHHGLIPAQQQELARRTPPTACTPAEAVQEDLPTALVERNLRSGQELAVEGHLVLLGNVHRGATVKAGGSIFILGTLRGVAHAGYLGDEGSVVLALRMQPSQIRIAGAVARAPGKAEERPYPEIARLNGGRIVIEPYGAPPGEAAVPFLLPAGGRSRSRRNGLRRKARSRG